MHCAAREVLSVVFRLCSALVASRLYMQVAYVYNAVTLNHGSCTHACRWPADHAYSSSQVVSICSGLADALSYLHGRGICHGDVYAHNIMLEGESHAVLCDFGAAYCYDRAAGGFWEAMEVRAFGLFMQGLLQHTVDQNSGCEGSDPVRAALQGQVDRCLADAPAERPTFAELQQQLQGLRM